VERVEEAIAGRGGHRILHRFRSRDHFIDPDHQGTRDGHRLQMEKDRLGTRHASHHKAPHFHRLLHWQST